MPYNANIPQANDQLSVSQGDILQNFQALEPVGNGYVLYSVQGGDPVTDATHEAMYSKAGTVSLQQELFIKRNAGTTYSQTNYSFTEAAEASPGWTRLPSGIMFKWGGPSIAGIAINLNATGPAFTQAFAATLGQTAGVPNPCFVISLAANSLTFISNPVGGSAYWFVIGV